MRENDDQLDIIRSIKAEGGYAKKWASRFGIGNPDLICSLPGIGIFLLEVKTEKGKVTSKQEFELENWRKAGGLAFVGIVQRKVQLLIEQQPCIWIPSEQVYARIKAQIFWQIKKG